MGINIIFILMLGMSYLAGYVSPAKNWFIAFFGLSYIILLIINILFVIIWLFRRRWIFLFSLVTIVLGWNNFNRHIRIRFSSAKAPATNVFKVMSFNVRNFDLYNYKKNWEFNFEKRNKIFDLLKQEAPDIICFQEFVYDKSGQFSTLDTLTKFLKANNYHTEYSSSSKSVNYFGSATFTSFPIVNKGLIRYNTNSGNLCIYTDVLIGGDTIRIYNVHLESIRLGQEDYKFAEKISNAKGIKNDEEIQQNSKRIVVRLKSAFIKRGPQAEQIAAHIQSCPYPIILCGDFNDTPASYAYRTVSKGLTDCFVESGSGIGNTYDGIFPSFRIDYIFHSDFFSSYCFETIHVDLSDHYPVKCLMKKGN